MPVKYKFQQSKIWDGPCTDPDPNGQIKVIKTQKGIEAARKKLPDPGLGRRWVLLEAKISQPPPKR